MLRLFSYAPRARSASPTASNSSISPAIWQTPVDTFRQQDQHPGFAAARMAATRRSLQWFGYRAEPAIRKVMCSTRRVLCRANRFSACRSPTTGLSRLSARALQGYLVKACAAGQDCRLSCRRLVTLGGGPQHRIACAAADVGRERDPHAGLNETSLIEQTRAENKFNIDKGGDQVAAIAATFHLLVQVRIAGSGSWGTV